MYTSITQRFLKRTLSLDSLLSRVSTSTSCITIFHWPSMPFRNIILLCLVLLTPCSNHPSNCEKGIPYNFFILISKNIDELDRIFVVGKVLLLRYGSLSSFRALCLLRFCGFILLSHIFLACRALPHSYGNKQELSHPVLLPSLCFMLFAPSAQFSLMLSLSCCKTHYLLPLTGLDCSIQLVMTIFLSASKHWL